MGFLKSATADYSKMTLVATDKDGASVTFGAAGLQNLAFGADGKLTPQGLCDAAAVLGGMRLEVKVPCKATPVGGDKAVGAGSAKGITVEARDGAKNYGRDFGVRPSAAALFIIQEQEERARQALLAREKEEREEQERRSRLLKEQQEQEERIAAEQAEQGADTAEAVVASAAEQEAEKRNGKKRGGLGK